jgi:hypothetical protein
MDLFNLTHPLSRTMALDLAAFNRKYCHKILLDSKMRPVRDADNFTAHCQPIV